MSQWWRLDARMAQSHRVAVQLPLCARGTFRPIRTCTPFMYSIEEAASTPLRGRAWCVPALTTVAFTRLAA